MTKKHSRELYRAARTVNDLETPAGGYPQENTKKRKEQAARAVAVEIEDLEIEEIR